MKIRRVVTGHDKSGKAVFVSDSEVEPTTVGLMPGAEFHKLWGGDKTPSFPDDGARPAEPTYFPPIGGFRFGMFTLPPATRGAGPPAVADDAAAGRELEQKLPGMAAYMEPNAPGMHTTDTIDFEIVLDGEVCLELDDGKEVQLRAGDTVVQNGTRHAWHNRGTKPVRIGVFIAGARHAKFPERRG
jgi:mannose-6-phosphate isomerase-like protein (cupin superfamily)